MKWPIGFFIMSRILWTAKPKVSTYDTGLKELRATCEMLKTM